MCNFLCETCIKEITKINCGFICHFALWSQMDVDLQSFPVFVGKVKDMRMAVEGSMNCGSESQQLATYMVYL